MRILVLSDTHGNIEYAIKALKNNDNIDMVIHLGDYFRDAQKLADSFRDIQFEYVYGNSDFMIGDVPSQKVLEISGAKIFITHGHKYSIKWDYDKLEKKARELEADIALFGHTHIAEIIEKDNLILLNPGSISDPRGGDNESYAVIEVIDKKISANLYYF